MKQRLLAFAFLLVFIVEGKSQSLFKDLIPGPHPGSSNPEQFMNVNGTMFFVARVPLGGSIFKHQLWKSDGTVSNTVLLRDSIVISGYGSVMHLRAFVNNTVFFTSSLNSSSSTTTTYLWKSDGTTPGTVCIDTLTHLAGTGGGGAPLNFVAAGGKVFWNMGISGHGRELWVTDGTNAGTMEVIDLSAGNIGGLKDQPMVSYNGKVYFGGNTHTSTVNYELFTSDGTPSGTVLVKEIDPRATFGSEPENWLVHNNELYFFADDNTLNGNYSLWKTDGTTSGTVKVFDSWGSSVPYSFKNEVYFAKGYGLWKTDGTTSGTVMIKDSVMTSVMGANDDYLITKFMNWTGSGYQTSYYRTDGTTAGTQTVSYNIGESASFTTLGNKMYKSRLDSGSWTSFKTWVTDGTASGTYAMWNFSANGLYAFDNKLFFQRSESATGVELWYYNPGPTSNNTLPVQSKETRVYPNPVKDKLSFDLSGENRNGVITLYNILGVEIRKIQNVESHAEIMVNDLSPGIYIYSISENGKNIDSGKIVIE